METNETKNTGIFKRMLSGVLHFVLPLVVIFYVGRLILFFIPKNFYGIASSVISTINFLYIIIYISHKLMRPKGGSNNNKDARSFFYPFSGIVTTNDLQRSTKRLVWSSLISIPFGILPVVVYFIAQCRGAMDSGIICAHDTNHQLASALEVWDFFIIIFGLPILIIAGIFIATIIENIVLRMRIEK